MVDRSSENVITEIKKWNERILIVNFNGNPMTTTIIHYSPCEGKHDAAEHYYQLTQATATIPKQNVLLTVGDFNAHISSHDTDNKFTFHHSTNTNGKLAIDYAEEADMITPNTHFQKSKGKLWTFLSDTGGIKPQVDYIMIRKKWMNSVKNCEAYNSFSSIGSDHRIITAKIKLSLRSNKKRTKRMTYDWSLLKNKNTSKEYSIMTQNRFEILIKNKDCDGSATSLYENFVKANDETSNLLIPKKEKLKIKIISEDTIIIDAKGNQDTLRHAKQKLISEYDNIESEELDRDIQGIEQANKLSKHAASWKLINKITGRKLSKSCIIKTRNKEDRLTIWYEFFKKLLGDKHDINSTEIKGIYPETLDISVGYFTNSEYTKVKNNLIDSKATGTDGIPPEVFKYTNLDDIILKFVNQMLIQNKKPAQWSKCDIVTIPKSGNLEEVGNYREIALSAVIAKIINKMLLNRIQPYIYPLLRPNKNGFRSGRFTMAHILTLRRLIEGIKSLDLKAVIIVVDFKKAFDSIDRGKMVNILAAYGIPFVS